MMADSKPLAIFGKTVRRFRELKGFSQERLAAEARLHRTYIGGVERGERNLSLLNVLQLARTLGVKPSVLMASLDNLQSDPQRRHDR